MVYSNLVAVTRIKSMLAKKHSYAIGRERVEENSMSGMCLALYSQSDFSHRTEVASCSFMLKLKVPLIDGISCWS